MAEVLSPLRTPRAPIPGMTPLQHQQQPRPSSSSPPTALEINTAFSPVDENGTFMTDRIIKQGWVMQRTRKTKNWKKRWFVLRGAVIGVYKDDSEYKMRHQIMLSELTACAELKSPKKKNVFGLFTPSRNWHLQANDPEDATDWVSKIRRTARLEETEEEFLMSPTIQAGHPIPKPLARRSSPPNSPGVREDCGLSSHNLDYSGASMSSTSELGGMISQISLDTPDHNAAPLSSPAHHSAAHSQARRASAGPASAGPTGGASLPLQRSISADPEPGVVRHESNLSSFAGHLSDSRVIWHGYLLVLRSKSGLRQWRKLWVVLRPRNVTFYKSDDEYRALKLIPMENIIDAVEIDPISKSKRHCMQLILENKSYKIAAKDEDVLTKWLGAFKSTIAKSRH